ncbi:MAG: Gfo/Idh/MocA family protein [Planctomycetaceae bacterium]
MTEPVYRAALIGLGFIGAGDRIAGEQIGQDVGLLDGTHWDALLNHPRVELVAGCDRRADRCDRFRERTGVPCLADWRALLEGERPDVVSVATNSPSHAEITIACAEAGVKAVYCEKPIATRIVDAERMIAACNAAGTLLVVNHNRRFNPNYRRLRDLVAAGELGELTSCNLQWGRGRLGNVGTHLFDAVEMLTGRTIESVSGTLDPAGSPDCRGPEYRDPGGWGLLRLSGGLMVTVDGADRAQLPARIVLNGANGRAVTGGRDITVTWTGGREERRPGPRHDATSMDHAMGEIVAALDVGRSTPYAPAIALRVLEAIIGFHVSHDLRSGWVDLPIGDVDRTREIRIG